MHLAQYAYIQFLKMTTPVFANISNETDGQEWPCHVAGHKSVAEELYIEDVLQGLGCIILISVAFTS